MQCNISSASKSSVSSILSWVYPACAKPNKMRSYWWGVTSCTKTPEVLASAQFFGVSGERTLFMLSCTQGVDISDFSDYPEDEVLLMPGTCFKVGKVMPGKFLGGATAITMTQISTRHDLLAPATPISQLDMRTTQTFNPMAATIATGSHELQRGLSKEQGLLGNAVAAKSRVQPGTKLVCAALAIALLALAAVAMNVFSPRTAEHDGKDVARATRSASTDVCGDSPPGWKDSLGNDCMAYTRKSFCTRTGQANLTSTGGNWRLSDGTLLERADSHGVDATVACCACGGGSTGPRYLVSFSPTASPTPPPTFAPSRAPSSPTAAPTNRPSGAPTTDIPTMAPTTSAPTATRPPTTVRTGPITSCKHLTEFARFLKLVFVGL